MPHSSSGPTVSLIIPVHNGGDKLRRCLLSVKALRTPPEEIIVVADGDSDGSWKQAEEFDMRVLRQPVQGGPARARNIGAHNAKGDVLFFIDADVTIPPDAIEQVVDSFQNESDIDALIGSYDDEPFETNFLSQYKNLLHHYVHQTSNREASTFWGACGAIRRDVFVKIGGFDEGYHRPSIEDIDLGYRLKKTGYKIHLLKHIQVKHLKHWGILSLAYELIKQGVQPIVLEKADKVGGIARTETYKDYYFDIGVHRFFTKINQVNKLWHEMLGEDFQKVR